MILRTSRLELRELEDDDLTALHAVLGDPVAMRAYEHGFSLDESRDWLQRQQRRYRVDGFGLWAVVLRETGEVIGDCGITRQKVEDDEVIEVGYHLRRTFWHNGFAVESAGASVSWAFEHLDIDDVYAKVRDTNLASMNVAVRLGMTVRRRFVTHYSGIDMPHYAFAVSRAAWATRPRGDSIPASRSARETTARGES